MSTTLEKIVSINVKPQKEKLLTHYRTLPELEGEILRALAVAHPINFDRNKALEYLNALGITHKFGKI